MFRCRPVALVLVACLLADAGGVAAAAEVVVKNDSLVDGGTVAVQAGFVANERAAAWLTSPCNGRIVAVQVFWQSASGGTPPSVEHSITIYANGTFPNPGAVLATLEAPLMTDGFMNEFRYLDEAGTVPIDIPVTAGQRFVVSFQFDNTPGLSGASVCTDVNGCQAQKNGLYAIPPGSWFNSCSLGLSGDFVIRAVVDCDEASGACCLPSGSCVSLSASQCSSQGGTYQGDNTSCGQVSCPQPTGACCMPDGSCSVLTAAQCSSQGGTYQGNNVTCAQANCQPQTVACCFEATGGCLNLTEQNCALAGGVSGGPGTQCATYVCFPMGACCLPDGSCLEDVSPEDCAAQGGTFQGDGTTCGSVNCPLPTGACCFATGFCLPLVESDCLLAGASWQGAGTDCADVDQNGTADECEAQTCDGDVDGDGDVDLADLSGLLSGFQTCSGNPAFDPAADFDASGCIDLADLSALLTNYGGLCR